MPPDSVLDTVVRNMDRMQSISIWRATPDTLRQIFANASFLHAGAQAVLLYCGCSEWAFSLYPPTANHSLPCSSFVGTCWDLE
ncbi:hypothetical protein AURDEDRAFT_163299 [Auricularia subglabra TFB-10046 SS5]|nr:hypothetical protein AURDEDRAFT_163299 [Auricularia subglabra TFB-10046 SS5]